MTKAAVPTWLELHILQNFSPSNLNRDDTGAPKDAMFGGVRRARISSQCLKRAMRQHFALTSSLPTAATSVRTKRAVSSISDALAKEHDPTESLAITRQIVEAVGLKLDPKTDKTSCLLFVPERHFGTIAGVIHENWKALAGAKKGEVPPALFARISAVIADASGAPEIAMFGRMIAEGDNWGMEAAAQVAHTISTHAVDTEFDFFTALDDLAPKGDHASAHMDTSQFSSACHYRYAALSLPLLRSNLKDDSLMAPSLRAYLQAFISAVPGGKQAAFAAHNPPSYVLAVTHAGQPYSLANAFARPVRPGANGLDLIGESILAMEHYWTRVESMHDARPQSEATACADRDVTRSESGVEIVPGTVELVRAVLGRVEP
jgi:CRISPR system Cascade subunit CasC